MTDSLEVLRERVPLRALDGPGHWMQWEAPDKVNRLLLDFLPR